MSYIRKLLKELYLEIEILNLEFMKEIWYDMDVKTLLRYDELIKVKKRYRGINGKTLVQKLKEELEQSLGVQNMLKYMDRYHLKIMRMFNEMLELRIKRQSIYEYDDIFSIWKEWNNKYEKMRAMIEQKIEYFNNQLVNLKSKWYKYLYIDKKHQVFIESTTNCNSSNNGSVLMGLSSATNAHGQAVAYANGSEGVGEQYPYVLCCHFPASSNPINLNNILMVKLG